MKLVADLHIHSHYSRATSKNLTFEHLWKWAQIKGVDIVGSGDLSHPGWLQEMREKLEPAEDGLFRLKEEFAAAMRLEVPPACQRDVRFLLTGEISNIYKRHDAVRKVHNVVTAPSLAAVEQIQIALEKIGNIRSDGRPILGLDSRDLLEIILEVDERCHLIPAHIWTPWFSMLGSKSGFDSVEACFGDLTPHIFAVETGLSSDPPMNWRVSNLDRYTLVSHSDAHSPQKLAREATIYDIDPSYDALFAALQSGDPARCLGTIEFFPEEGKYHFDGHRKCDVCWHPQETQAHDGRCIVCGKPVTIGVQHRVEQLADRPEGARPPRPHPFYSLIPLPEIVAEIYEVGANTKTVQTEYIRLLGRLGPELSILRDLPLDEIAAVVGEQLAEGLSRMRAGNVTADPGFDGEFGVIKLFGEEIWISDHQMALFVREERAAQEKAEAREERLDLLQETSEDSAAAGFPLADSSPPPPTQPPSPLSPSVSHWLEQLNDEQRAAVVHVEGPLLIVAGPGTGKTRTLTVRMAYLLTQKSVSPEAVLAITFTNKAAEEMAERLCGLVGADVAARVTVQTFHALGAQILHEWATEAGLDPHFAVIADEDRRMLLRGVCPDLGERALDLVLQRIAAAKNELLTPDEVGAGQASEEIGEDFQVIYQRYEEALRQSNVLDFDDLILRTVRLCETQSAVRRALQDRFRWISVDEYQDVNYAQVRFLRLLVAERTNLCVIGDPDQAIYGFRGADHGYFQAFTQEYSGAQTVHLTRNYRSSHTILAAATGVIAKNPDREALDLLAEFVDTVKVDVYQAPTDRAEAEYVVHQIEQMVGGTSYFSLDSGRIDDDTTPVERSFADFAVLYRLNSQSRLLQEAFERSGIPYQIVGQTSFYAEKSVQVLLDLLWLRYNPRSQIHWERLLTLDRHPPMPSALGQIAEIASSVALPWPERMAQAIYADGLRPEQRARLLALGQLYHAWHGNEPPLVATLIEHAQRFCLEQGGVALADEDLRRLTGRAMSFGSALGDFLVAAALQREADAYDPRSDRVTLMTIHAAKGLEFPTVFVIGCEDGLLPYTPEHKTIDLAEERRLFYVAMTRAARRLILAHARRRFFFGRLMENPRSRFVDDIAQALIQMRTAQTHLKSPSPENVQLTLFE